MGLYLMAFRCAGWRFPVFDLHLIGGYSVKMGRLGSQIINPQRVDADGIEPVDGGVHELQVSDKLLLLCGVRPIGSSCFLISPYAKTRGQGGFSFMSKQAGKLLFYSDKPYFQRNDTAERLDHGVVGFYLPIVVADFRLCPWLPYE